MWMDNNRTGIVGIVGIVGIADMNNKVQEEDMDKAVGNKVGNKVGNNMDNIGIVVLGEVGIDNEGMNIVAGMLVLKFVAAVISVRVVVESVHLNSPNQHQSPAFFC